MAQTCHPWHKRIGLMSIGLFVNETFNFGFDLILYPFIIGFYGPLWGGIIMTIAAAISCYLTIKFYDWSCQDWLGIETLKEVREFEHSHINRFIAKILKKNYWTQLIGFSIIQDAFIVTVLLREGAHQYGVMTKKDWRNFWASLFISNVFWIAFCWSGIKAIEAIGAKIETAVFVLIGIFILLTLVGLVYGKLYAKKTPPATELITSKTKTSTIKSRAVVKIISGVLNILAFAGSIFRRKTK
ncbi:MAG: hypothetical protein WCO30_01650 [bacterium]